MPRDSARWATSGPSAPSMRHNSSRVSATDTGAVPDTNDRAIWIALGSNSSGASTSLTSPRANASDAGTMRPLSVHSKAVALPTILGRNHDEHASGTNPRRVKTKPNRAVSDAIRISAGNVLVEGVEPFRAMQPDHGDRAVALDPHHRLRDRRRRRGHRSFSKRSATSRYSARIAVLDSLPLGSRGSGSSLMITYLGTL